MKSPFVACRRDLRQERGAVTPESLEHLVVAKQEQDDLLCRLTAYDVTESDPPGYDWQTERAANEFAADLLMPREK